MIRVTMLPRTVLLPLLLLPLQSLLAKPSITISGDTFILASSETAANGELREYLKPGETLDRWTRLVAVRRFPQLTDAKAYIQAMVAQYHTKRPQMSFAVMQENQSKDWVFDFLDYPDGGPVKYMEWNYFKVKMGPNGLIVYQYAIRHYYKKKIEEVSGQIGPAREQALGVLLKATFEETEDTKDTGK